MNYKISNTEPDYAKASILLFICAALHLLLFALTTGQFLSSIPTSIFAILSIVVSLGIWIGLAILIRNRTDWARYVLLVLTILNLISAVYSVFTLLLSLLISALSILTIGLKIWATVILFKRELNRA